MTDEAMADELRAAGHDLDVPAPDPAAMAAAVHRRITADGRAARAWPMPRHGWLAAAAVAFGFAVLLAGSAQVRAAVVDFFRFAGIVVERQDTPPGTGAAQAGSPLRSVDEARALVDFPVLVPPDAGAPERVEVLDGRVVSLSYKDFRLDQFDGTFEPGFVKTLPDEVIVQWTDVDGGTALWLVGPHSIVYVDRAGERRTETSRLSANALVWQLGPVTVRLEGALTLDEARTIAESLR